MKESRGGWGFLGGNDREGSLECGAVVVEKSGGKRESRKLK